MVLLLLHNPNFDTVLNGNVNIWYETPKEVATHRLNFTQVESPLTFCVPLPVLGFSSDNADGHFSYLIRTPGQKQRRGTGTCAYMRTQLGTQEPVPEQPL